MSIRVDDEFNGSVERKSLEHKEVYSLGLSVRFDAPFASDKADLILEYTRDFPPRPPRPPFFDERNFESYEPEYLKFMAVYQDNIPASLSVYGEKSFPYDLTICKFTPRPNGIREFPFERAFRNNRGVFSPLNLSLFNQRILGKIQKLPDHVRDVAGLLE